MGVFISNQEVQLFRMHNNVCSCAVNLFAYGLSAIKISKIITTQELHFFIFFCFILLTAKLINFFYVHPYIIFSLALAKCTSYFFYYRHLLISYHNLNILMLIFCLCFGLLQMLKCDESKKIVFVLCLIYKKGGNNENIYTIQYWRYFL